MAYPYKLFRLLMLFVKEAFITIFNLSPSLNLNFNMRMPNKELITVLTTCTYVGLGFVRKCNNFNIANIIFRRVIMAM